MRHANDGDWVESLTALVEDQDGTLRLLSHRHARARRAQAGAAAARLGARRRLSLETVTCVQ